MNMVQTIITLLIVAAAVLLAARRLIRTLRSKNSCSCNCSQCPIKKGECHCPNSKTLPDIRME
ncbi:MAG: FeoB-associated Cys-rich membrane protein [Bacteroidales bacterium]|nr:FeoB-associated Cys-rich membrane protein [Bacteroidales bacterium]